MICEVSHLDPAAALWLDMVAGLHFVAIWWEKRGHPLSPFTGSHLATYKV